MKTVQLGQTGEQVSALCLGAMYYGTAVDEEMSFRLLDQYLDAGGTFIDTANIYAWWAEGGKGGESEELLCNWMKKRKNREQLFIASKVGFGYGEIKQGLKASQIVSECEKSLRKLGVDTIDLYYAHVDDRSTPLGETMESFNQLVKSGKVRHIGASNFRAWRLELAHWVSQSNDLAEYSCVQQRYTYLQPRAGTSFAPQLAANDDLLDYCRRRSMTLLAYSPLLAGAYTRPEKTIGPQYNSDDNQQRLKALREVAGALNVSPNQVVLAWMLQSDPMVVPVFSASNPDQMQENLAVLKINLSEEQMKRLNTAGTE
jgi:aryl-alcohol dehydrogenase-like predicted oxidoreductase